MSFELLKEFFGDAWFIQGTITLTSHTFTYSEGEVSDTQTSSVAIKGKKLLIPVSEKDLIDAGMGQYVTNGSYYLYTRNPLKYPNGTLGQKGDKVEFNNEVYTLISQLPYGHHGFYKYLITKYMPNTVAD